MYEQSLCKVIQPIRENTIKRLNKGKKWKYGYNKEHDIVVISKDGTIGEVYEIQNHEPKRKKKFNKKHPKRI